MPEEQPSELDTPTGALAGIIKRMGAGKMRARAEELKEILEEQDLASEAELIKSFTTGNSYRNEDERTTKGRQLVRNLSHEFRKKSKEFGRRVYIDYEEKGEHRMCKVVVEPLEVGPSNVEYGTLDTAVGALTKSLARVERTARLTMDTVEQSLLRQQVELDALKTALIERSDVTLLGEADVGVNKMNQLFGTADAIFHSTLSAPISRGETEKKTPEEDEEKRRKKESEDNVFTRFEKNYNEFARSGKEFKYLFAAEDATRVRRVRDCLMVCDEEQVVFSKPRRFWAAYYPRTDAPHPNFIIFRRRDSWQMVEIFSGLKEESSFPDPAYLKRNGAYVKDKYYFFNFQWGDDTGGPKAVRVNSERDLEELLELSNDIQRDRAAAGRGWYKRLNKHPKEDCYRRVELYSASSENSFVLRERKNLEEFDLYAELPPHQRTDGRKWRRLEQEMWSIDGAEVTVNKGDDASEEPRRFLVEDLFVGPHSTSSPPPAA